MNKERRKIDKIYSQIDKIASKGKDNFLEYYLLVDDLVKSSDYDNLLQSLYYHYDINIVKLNSIEDVKKKTWKDIMYATKGPLTKKLKKLYDIKKVYQTSFDIWSEDTSFIIINLSSPLSMTYSSTTFSNGIEVIRNNSTININIINPEIYEITLNNATWSNGVPSNIEKFQEIKGITQSSYRLDIPITYNTNWLIKTKELSPFKELNYNLTLNTHKYLGKIVEVDAYTDESKYLIKNKMFAKITKSRKVILEVTKVGELTPTILDTYDFTVSDDQNMYNKYVTAINLLTQ